MAAKLKIVALKLAREHVNAQGTLARKHVNAQGTLAREHVGTQGTLVRTWARKHAEHVGT